MVSSEMPEVLGMSDRIVVMREGRVAAILETQDSHAGADPRAAGRRVRGGGADETSRQSFSGELPRAGPPGLHRRPLRRCSRSRNPSFLTLSNIRDLLTNTAILGILAVGMMMVMLTGGIDLSIGATIALSGMVSALTVSAVPAPASARLRSWRAWRSGSWPAP